MAKAPSPAQLRVRREFARRAKAGTLREGSKLKVTRRSASTSSTRTRRTTSSSRGRTKRRTTVAKNKSNGGGKAKTIGIASTLADINAAGQMIEPMVPAILQALSGNVQGAVSAAKTGAKEASSTANLVQAAGPSIGVRVVKKAMGWFGISNPRLGKSKFRLI